MTKDEIIEMAIQGHASTRDAIRWAINQAIQNCPMCAQHREAKNLWRKVALDLFTRQK